MSCRWFILVLIGNSFPLVGCSQVSEGDIQSYCEFKSDTIGFEFENYLGRKVGQFYQEFSFSGETEHLVVWSDTNPDCIGNAFGRKYICGERTFRVLLTPTEFNYVIPCDSTSFTSSNFEREWIESITVYYDKSIKVYRKR